MSSIEGYTFEYDPVAPAGLFEISRRITWPFHIHNRRAILGLLVSSQQSVGEIERHLHMSQPTVSKHLRVLRDTVRLRNDFKGRFHALYILHSVYTCQGINSQASPASRHSRDWRSSCLDWALRQRSQSKS